MESSRKRARTLRNESIVESITHEALLRMQMEAAASTHQFEVDQNDLYWPDYSNAVPSVDSKIKVTEDGEDEDEKENKEDEEDDEDDEDEEDEEEQYESLHRTHSPASTSCDTSAEVSDTENESEEFNGYKSTHNDGFNIMEKIAEPIQNYIQFNIQNDDGKEKLLSESPFTVSQFATQMQGIFSKGNVDESTATEILGLMARALPSANIPAHTSKLGNHISTMHKFTPPSKQLIEIGACPNDCCVFTWKHEKQCLNCSAYRYTSQHKYCNINSKSLFYRSITATVMELLTYPLFERLLSYDFRKPSLSTSYQIMDVMDGENAKKHMSAMHRRFTTKTSKLAGKHVELSLLISLFYDGIQLFRRKVENYWPLFCTILNLPPTLRTNVGVGMFMLTAFRGKMDSATENFLFDRCLVSELQKLRKGIVVKVHEISYFLQVRCIAHILDTKALGKQLRVQEVGSYNGCPLCNNMKGARRNELSKVIYGGHRQALDMHHALRMYGHSTQCCPPRNRDEFIDVSDYLAYLESFKTFHRNDMDKVEAVNIILQMRRNKATVCRRMRDQVVTICSTKFDINNFIKNVCDSTKDDPIVWHHDEDNYSEDKFRKVLWYQDLEYREQKNYSRRNYADYVQDGRVADELNRARKSKAKTPKPVEVNGVKGSWAFSKLKYADSTDFCYDLGHSGSILAKNLIDIMKSGHTLDVPKSCRHTVSGKSSHETLI